MKAIQYFFPFLLLSTLLSSSSIAQSIQLPNISSQYLTQGNDYGAVLLVIQYEDNKATWLLGGESFEFTQENLYTYLDSRYKKLTAEEAAQSNLKVEASADMPIQYLQDVYFWAQIYGNRSLHLAMYESMSPDKKQYLPIDVLPFTLLEEACAFYSSSIKSSLTPIDAFSQLHPNTERLTTDKKTNLTLATKSIRPKHYIPQHILHIDLKENNEVIFKKQQANTMVLGALIQSELANNYGSSYEKAKPQKHLWLNLRMDKKVTFQQYAEVVVALQEAFQLYWEELSFNKFQKAYLELDVQQQWTIRQSSPKLVAQYNAIELLYIKEKLSEGDPKTWSDL